MASPRRSATAVLFTRYCSHGEGRIHLKGENVCAIEERRIMPSRSGAL